MEFVIRKSSDWDFKETREIEDIPALLRVIGEFGHKIIISPEMDYKTCKFTGKWEIEIYDDYRE